MNVSELEYLLTLVISGTFYFGLLGCILLNIRFNNCITNRVRIRIRKYCKKELQI